MFAMRSSTLYMPALFAGLLALAGCSATEPETALVIEPAATISGPIEGPGEMYTGMRPTPEGHGLADYGYEAKEYFISGMAEGQPYTTRIIVRAPRDPSDFSGIVVAEPMHSSGFSLMFQAMREYMMSRGHASVGIAPQKAATESQVVASNPERYASINIPSAEQANEIIAQAGELIRANLADGPLPGMTVRHVLLTGTSQSSATVRTYMGALHGSRRLPDGSPIYSGYLPTSTLGSSQIEIVDVPVVHMPTQTEVTSQAEGGNAYRREDSDDPASPYRLYEVAGLPHADGRENRANANSCDMPVSRFPLGAMMSVGLHHLIEWVDNGTVPPHADRIMVDGDTAGDNSLLALDAHGNATGGIRNTYVDVPVAQWGVPNTLTNPPADNPRGGFQCSIIGFEIAMTPEQLADLYESPEDYRMQVETRMDQLIREGWFLPEYQYQVREDAESVSF